MKITMFLFAAIFTQLPFVGRVEANIVFDNSTNVFEIASTIRTKAIFRIADDFSFPSSSSVDGVRFWGGYQFAHPVVDDFAFFFYGDDGFGLPDGGNIVATRHVGHISRVATGSVVTGIDVFLYEASFPSISFAQGDTFWLSITNDVSDSFTPIWWGDQRMGNAASSSNFGRPLSWRSNANYPHMQFQLLAVPEPTALVFLSVGLIALLGASFRRR